MVASRVEVEATQVAQVVGPTIIGRVLGEDSPQVRSAAAPGWAIVATTRPRRTTVNVSPRCSTASSRSAKRLEASVALISDIIRFSDSEAAASSAAPAAPLGETRQLAMLGA